MPGGMVEGKATSEDSGDGEEGEDANKQCVKGGCTSRIKRRIHG